MKYILKEANPSGGYSSIMESNPFLVTDELAIWPDELETDTFYKYKGFVILTIEEAPISEAYDILIEDDSEEIPTVAVVSSYSVNQEAYDVYIVEHPDPGPTPPTPPEPDQITLMQAQIDSLSERNDFLEDCIAEMATQVYNY